MTKLSRDVKGQTNLGGILGLLITGGLTLVIIVITLAIGSEITQEFVDDDFNLTMQNSTLNHSQFGVVANVSREGLSGLANLTGQVGLIGTIIALSVVLLILIGLLFRQFAGGRF